MANLMWPFYFNALNGLIVATAFVILVSGLDDLFIDVCFWSSEFVRRVIRRSRGPRITAEDLRARDERWFAIMVPAWQEAEVIAHMIENTLETLDYSRYVVFLGT
jgi:bacteriophage N4 adsorption protein B